MSATKRPFKPSRSAKARFTYFLYPLWTRFLKAVRSFIFTTPKSFTSERQGLLRSQNSSQTPPLLHLYPLRVGNEVPAILLRRVDLKQRTQLSRASIYRAAIAAQPVTPAAQEKIKPLSAQILKQKKPLHLLASAISRSFDVDALIATALQRFCLSLSQKKTVLRKALAAQTQFPPKGLAYCLQRLYDAASEAVGKYKKRLVYELKLTKEEYGSVISYLYYEISQKIDQYIKNKELAYLADAQPKVLALVQADYMSQYNLQTIMQAMEAVQAMEIPLITDAEKSRQFAASYGLHICTYLLALVKVRINLNHYYQTHHRQYIDIASLKTQGY